MLHSPVLIASAWQPCLTRSQVKAPQCCTAQSYLQLGSHSRCLGARPVCTPVLHSPVPTPGPICKPFPLRLSPQPRCFCRRSARNPARASRGRPERDPSTRWEAPGAGGTGGSQPAPRCGFAAVHTLDPRAGAGPRNAPRTQSGAKPCTAGSAARGQARARQAAQQPHCPGQGFGVRSAASGPRAPVGQGGAAQRRRRRRRKDAPRMQGRRQGCSRQQAGCVTCKMLGLTAAGCQGSSAGYNVLEMVLGSTSITPRQQQPSNSPQRSRSAALLWDLWATHEREGLAKPSSSLKSG